MSAVTALRLRNFRSYDQMGLSALSPSFVVLTGPNGAGKTNILEAISFLSPGKGMRSADLGDVQNRDMRVPWGISAQIASRYGDITLATMKDPEKNRRAVHVQGEPAKSQNILADYLSCLWLTPQMDRLFLDASSARRRFLDRMVFSFDAGHAGRITRYENAMGQRSRLLKEGRATPAWLDSLESQMAQAGIAVAAARADFVDRLQKVCNRRSGSDFPVADLSVSGFVEDSLARLSALGTEALFRETLCRNRAEDAVTGGAGVGIHRSDFIVSYRAKSMPATACSTGEQKALLIGMILAHADLMMAEKGDPPILLLDEVAAHLDPARRAALYAHLSEIGGQVWMTGTEAEIFAGIPHNSSLFLLHEGQFLSQKIDV